MSFLTLYCNSKVTKKKKFISISLLFHLKYIFSLPPFSLLTSPILSFFSLSLSVPYFFLLTFFDSLPFFYHFFISPFLQIWLGFKFVYYSALVVSFVDFGYGFRGFDYGSGLWLRWWVVVGGGDVTGCGIFFFFFGHRLL